ncbi:hypothetical protein ACQCX2_17100 [Propionibacteriaceae bacterium Y1700]|uniref:hypothetical protein n=1 Tax=Microlunatus sp. Y1700 TaxID=3418487 RepID=UPI003DA77A6A
MNDSWNQQWAVKDFVEHPDAVAITPRELPVHDAVRIEYDGAGRPATLQLKPGWERSVPAPALAAVVTAIINNHRLSSLRDTGAPRAHSLWDSSMPVRVAQEIQAELAQIQRDQLQAFSHAQRDGIIMVSSRNRHITALIHLSSVVAVQIDSVWVESAAAISIAETFANVMSRVARELNERNSGTVDDRHKESFQRLGETLADYEKG